jgi:hypothetical protein
MSFRRAHARTHSSNVTDLTIRLRDEFRKPSDDPKTQPIIIAEPSEPAPISRLFVIWDAWEELNAQERSEIIMDAYKQHVGIHEAVKVSVAMGLTSSEARTLQIA